MYKLFPNVSCAFVAVIIAGLHQQEVSMQQRTNKLVLQPHIVTNQLRKIQKLACIQKALLEKSVSGNTIIEF